jgi:hypothetical protein
MNLDLLVPVDDSPPDWDDVLRRARRRRPRRRLVVAVAALVAALAGAPALAVLLRDRGLDLPAQADRNNVVVIVQPHTGRILVEAAPWQGHDGFCYLLLRLRAGCVPRSTSGTAILKPPLFGWTFDPRVAAGSATTFAGKQVPLTVAHFPKLNVTLFLVRDRLPRMLRSVVLRDAAGKVVARFTR